MIITFPHEGVFIARVFALHNPDINGHHAVGIHGLRVQQFSSAEISLHRVDLSLVIDGRFFQGEVVEPHLLMVCNSPALQLSVPPRQAIMQNWIDLRSVYSKSVGDAKELVCSGLYLFKLRKQFLTQATSIQVSVTDSLNETSIVDAPVPKIAWEFALNNDVTIHC